MYHEGAASFFAPPVTDAKGVVFYNPSMRLNRDLAISVANVFAEDSGRLAVADPMTGCGVRAVRYALELAGKVHVRAGDANRYAVALAKRNVKRNRVERKVSVEVSDANEILTRHGRTPDRFSLVDLDPFGSPVTFLDSASRAVAEGGILAVTATDTAVLCGARAEACFRKYGARPLRTEYSHEIAARILLFALASAAARHEIGILPLLTHRTAHYIRVYVQVGRRATAANATLKHIGYAHHCFHCLARGLVNRIMDLPRNCPDCSKPVAIGGPLWTGPLFEPRFLTRLLTTVTRRNGTGQLITLINSLLEESAAPACFFVIDAICDKYNLPMPKPSSIIHELRSQGYTAVASHFRPNALRTDIDPGHFAKLIRQLSTERLAQRLRT